MSTRVDPFGALEFFCSNAEFELAAPGVVRVFMTLEEDGHSVVKVKLLLPLASLPTCITSASLFAADQVMKTVMGAGLPMSLN